MPEQPADLKNRIAAEAELDGISRPVVSGLNYAKGIMEDMNDAVFRSTGHGSSTNQMQDFCLNIDRYAQNVLPGNRECVGLTFITRPKLNLSSPSLMMDRTFARLDNPDVDSIGFMVRHLLDTKLARSPEGRKNVNQSGLIEGRNPFITPLCNGLLGISGFPDEVLQTTTTTGGFFNEDQTFAQGGDSMRKSYDLTLNFKDIQYTPNAWIMETWVKWMILAMEGRVVAYGEDIDRQRIPYTCSIYRFILDPSKRYITRCAKATGCFPMVGVNGGVFNVNEGVNYIEGANKFSVPFKANHIMYNDYVIYIMFNLLMHKYVGVDSMLGMADIPDTAEYNYAGIPYIESTTINGKPGPARLVFKDIYSFSKAHSPIAVRSVSNMVAPLSEDLATKLITAKKKAGELSEADATFLINQHKEDIKKDSSANVKRERVQSTAIRKRMTDASIVGGKYV